MGLNKPRGQTACIKQKASSLGNQDIPNALVDPESEKGIDLTVLSDAVTSAYCQFDAPQEPYLRCMNAVRLQASRAPEILGLDANAVFPMWFGKLSRHAEGQANYRRRELEARAAALNQSTEVYTFDNYRARSNIDVKIGNEAASMWATYDCRVDEWELSEHNIITVAAEPTTTSAVESIAAVPSWNFSNASWQLFEEEMFDAPLEPYLRYMDAVRLLASRTPEILGLDENAVSPMWFGKLSRHAEGQANYSRGELLSEWILEARAVALNQPTEVYAFDNYRARSDIDVTIVNEAASMWATYEWRVGEWELSEHNIITVAAEPTTTSAVESIAPVPSWNFSNASWQLFEEEMLRRAADIPENFSESPLDQQVSTLRRIVHDVCDVALGSKAPGSPSRRARWWTADPCAARREVRRLRRRLQDARLRDADATAELLLVELRRALADYKKLIWRAKKEY
ncbi:hypothetical protein KR200_002524 [Drosophila serrata]|nr:hypothetical protein KR200_002524 [Drosophila serrata]